MIACGRSSHRGWFMQNSTHYEPSSLGLVTQLIFFGATRTRRELPESALPLAPHLAAIAWSVAADVHIEKTFEI